MNTRNIIMPEKCQTHGVNLNLAKYARQTMFAFLCFLAKKWCKLFEFLVRLWSDIWNNKQKQNSICIFSLKRCWLMRQFGQHFLTILILTHEFGRFHYLGRDQKSKKLGKLEKQKRRQKVNKQIRWREERTEWESERAREKICVTSRKLSKLAKLCW